MVVATKADFLSWVQARRELGEGKVAEIFLVIVRGFEGGHRGRLRRRSSLGVWYVLGNLKSKVLIPGRKLAIEVLLPLAT
jgi:hypothetical protein